MWTMSNEAHVSDHFDGVRFFNPTGANGQPFWKVPRMLLEPSASWPPHIEFEPHQPPQLIPAGGFTLTFIGHSTFLIQSAGGNVITDPVFADRAGPWARFGPKRVRKPGVAFDDLPPIALVLISHNHYDHCDLTALAELARRSRPRVVTLLKNGPLLRSAGIDAEELDWWQPSATAPLPVTATPAQHFSARGPFDRNRALWGGFVLQVGELRVFFAGDSGYGPHFKEIGARLGPLDVALLPIGAYEPRWFMKDIHMNPVEAVQAHRDLRVRRSVAMHFGTFQLTPEAINEPERALARARSESGLRNEDFVALDFGQTLTCLPPG
jgi:L-ascorbate metabolism protein UlaG (beta-lactamase superfamily)